MGRSFLQLRRCKRCRFYRWYFSEKPSESYVNIDSPFFFPCPSNFQPGQQNTIIKETRISISRDGNKPLGTFINDIETSSTSPLFVGKRRKMQFRRQVAAFLVLEFGVIFHSVIIGLNLATTGAKFKVLFPIIVFHRK
jgi:hypothetical protein